MPRGRSRYLRDRASRMNRRGDYRRVRAYEPSSRMDYRNDYAEFDSSNDFRQDMDRRGHQEPHMAYQRSRESRAMRDYDMNSDYRRDRDYRDRDYRDRDYRDRDYRDSDYRGRGDYRGDYNGDYRRDYADYSGDYHGDLSDSKYDEEYHKDIEEWIKKLKKQDRFGLEKEQAIQSAKDMGVSFEDYDEEEFYAIFLMHVSDYPQIANEPRTYLAMAKAWLEDKDLEIEPSEKVCKYLYEIVLAKEEE